MRSRRFRNGFRAGPGAAGVYMKLLGILGKTILMLSLAGFFLPCPGRAEAAASPADVQSEPVEVPQERTGALERTGPLVRTGPREAELQAGQPAVPQAVRQERLPAKPQGASEQKAGSGSEKSLRKPPAASSEVGGPAASGAGPAASGAGPGTGGLDLDALEDELGRILDESVQEALAEQRKSFERDYSRLWDSRSFWRRVAVGEGGAIVACLLGGILVWQLGR